MRNCFLGATFGVAVLLTSASAATATAVTYDLVLTPTLVTITNAQIIETEDASDALRSYCTADYGVWDCFRETIRLDDPDSAFGYVDYPDLEGSLTITDGRAFSCDIDFLEMCADDFEMDEILDSQAYTLDLDSPDFAISYFISPDSAEWLFPDRAAWWGSADIDTADPSRSTDALPSGWDTLGLDLRGYVDIGIEYDVAVSATTVVSTPLPASLPLVLAGLGAFGLTRRRRAATT